MLEDALVTPVSIRCLLHLRLSRLGIDNAVLPRNGFTVPLGVVRLLLVEVLQLFPERALQRLNLRSLQRILRLPCGIPLEILDFVLDLPVLHLGVGDYALELRRGLVIGRRQHALVDVCDFSNAPRELADPDFGTIDARQKVLLAQWLRAVREGLCGSIPVTLLRLLVRLVWRRLLLRRICRCLRVLRILML